MKNKLKPCFNCDSTNTKLLSNNVYDSKIEHYVMCDTCQKKSPMFKMDENKSDVAKKNAVWWWNKMHEFKKNAKNAQ